MVTDECDEVVVVWRLMNVMWWCLVTDECDEVMFV